MKAIMSRSTCSGFSSGTMRRSMRNVTTSGTTLVLMPPLINPTTSDGMIDAFDIGLDRLELRIVQVVERGQQLVGGAERIDAGIGPGGVG